MECKYKKEDGTPCKRDAFEGKEYCWQHLKGFWNKLIYGLCNVLGVKKRFLVWFVIFSLIIFVVQGYANYHYNKKIEQLYFKTDLEVEISPFLYQASFGEYFPLIITNTGDYTFRNVEIFISTCKMLEDNYYEYYRLPILPSHSEREIPFGNQETIEAFKEKACYPFSKGRLSNAPSVSFNPFTISGEVSDTGLLCGVCYFNATLFAEYEKNNKTLFFNKSIYSFFDFPAEITITISP